MIEGFLQRLANVNLGFILEVSEYFRQIDSGALILTIGLLAKLSSLLSTDSLSQVPEKSGVPLECLDKYPYY